MQINRCPKCGREPTVKLINCFGEYITIKCCDLRITHRGNSQAEAVAKWNEMTKGINK